MDFVFAPDDRKAAVARMADPRVKVISLTVTEKGYCIGVDGELDTGNPLVAHDLGAPEEPQSAVGFIFATVRLRVPRRTLAAWWIWCTTRRYPSKPLSPPATAQ